MGKGRIPGFKLSAETIARIKATKALNSISLEERFWSKVDRSGGPDACWPWTASKNPKGYGVFAINGGGRQTFPQAHRTAWTLMYHGPLPAWPLVLDHVCRRRDCVNPSHLRVISQRDNCVTFADTPFGINSRKTHCKHGHLLSGDNVARVLNRGKNKEGTWMVARFCLTCWPGYWSHPRRFWLPEDMPDAKAA